MIGITWKFIVVLGAAGVIALAVTPADARSARNMRSTVSNQPFHSALPSVRRSFNYSGRVSGGGINFRDGRMGANWNPNQ